jgi:hypothetical protein
MRAGFELCIGLILELELLLVLEVDFCPHSASAGKKRDNPQRIVATDVQGLVKSTLKDRERGLARISHTFLEINTLNAG